VIATSPELDRKRLLADEIAGRFPDARGRFGPFGGRYVPETLIPALERLERGIREHLPQPEFQKELAYHLKSWVGRPTSLTFAKKLGAKRIVAETGAGQHGVASAAACARLGLPCVVYMGDIDMERQAPNVGRMNLLGAKVVPVTSGDRTLRAAIDEALRDWVSDPLDTYYLLGSAVGPHPYPYLVRELQSVIGREARAQMLSEAGALPDVLIACVGGGSNSIGIFHPFIGDVSVEIIGIEAGGRGAGLGENSATLSAGRPGVLHGSYSMLLQDEHGQVQETHSVSAGLDYPGVGPEHSLLLATGRVRYESASDDDALAAVRECCESEGILPALESAHALAGAKRWAKANPGKKILVGLSGRGDKDMPTLQRTLLAEKK
jgi:tryptophan synthase beta chain